MAFREALFWISIAIGETGLFFILEAPTNLAGKVLLMFGTAGAAYSIYKNSRYTGPIVDAVSYGFKNLRQGMHLNSSREPAYSVNIESAKIGDHVLHFDATLYRLDGDGFIEGLTSCANASTDLQGVWTDLKLHGGNPPACLPIVISYRDAEGHAYKTRCELCRDVDAPDPGFSLRYVRRGRVGLLEQLRDRFKTRKKLRRKVRAREHNP
jgi:hypothetical protein